MRARQFKKIIKEVVQEALEVSNSNNNNPMPVIPSSNIPALARDEEGGIFRKILSFRIERLIRNEEFERQKIEEETKTSLYRIESELYLEKADSRKDAIIKTYKHEQDRYVERENKKTDSMSEVFAQEDLTDIAERITVSKKLTKDQKVDLVTKIVKSYMGLNGNE